MFELDIFCQSYDVEDDVNVDDDDDGDYDVDDDEDYDMIEDEDDERGSPVSSSSLSASTLVNGLPEQVGSEQKIHHCTLFRFSSSLFFGVLNQDRTGQKWNHVDLILYFLPIKLQTDV